MELIVYRKGEPYTIFYDECDHDFIMLHKWNISAGGYARTNIKNKSGKQSSLLMHRFMLNLSDISIEVDHINHDKLDNRRCNLRLCTQAENKRNKSAAGKSKYLGVSYDRGRLRATIMIDSKCRSLGYFGIEEDAARAYDKKAKEIYGEFANLNFKE